jgi:peptide/nickel transport system substrate-binding protein
MGMKKLNPIEEGNEMKDKKEDLGGLTRREFLYLSGVGMAGMTLSSIPELGYGAEKKPKYGGSLRVGERYSGSGLDAHRNQEMIDCQNYLLMYNALTIMGPLPQVRMYADLAKSWEISKDGREYIFLLREGVKFHHGKEFDSGDAKYSIERVMNPATRSPRAYAHRWIDSVNIIDKYHLKIRLKEPFAPFLTTLTITTCPIIPAGWEPSPTKPAPGTGPFVFKSFVSNETSELTRFDQYWEIDEKTGDRLPYLHGIYVKKIVDETVRWSALRAGDLDYIQHPPAKLVLQELKKPTPGVVVVLPQPVGNALIYFNVSKPPFDNKKVRQAVAYAIDKKEIVNAAYWGLGEPVNNQPFLNRSRMNIPVKDREVDLAKAKQLLVEAGYPNGLKTEFLEYSYAMVTDPCQVIMGQLQKIGIEGSMQVIDRAPYYVKMRKGEYSVSVTSDTERLDPDDAYYMRLHSGEIGKNNWSSYSNKELNELLEKGRTTWKWEDRVPIYQKVVEIIKEDLPIFYFAKMVIPIAYRDYLKGHGAGAATWFGYYGGGMKKVWLDK